MTAVLIAGSPGSGKTTVSQLLKERLDNAPLIDFGTLREFHLKPDWSNQSPEEEKMAFENLLSLLGNYEKYGYTYVIVNDLKDERVQSFPTVFTGSVKIFTLTVDDKILRQRIEDPNRNSGFKEVEAAMKWNKQVKERGTVQNEYKIDNSHSDPRKTVEVILEKLNEN